MRQRKQAIIVVPVMGMEGEGDIFLLVLGVINVVGGGRGRKDRLKFVGMTTGDVFYCLNC